MVQVKSKQNIFDKFVGLIKAIIRIIFAFFESLYNISDDSGNQYGRMLKEEDYKKSRSIEGPQEGEVRRREIRSMYPDSTALGDPYYASYSIS